MSSRRRKLSAAVPVVTGLLLLLASTHIGYIGLRSYAKMHRGQALASNAEPYSRRSMKDDRSILILGDSLAYGVGASSPENSLAGQLAARFSDYSVVNKAKVGATTEELADSIAGEVDGPYDAAFIVIGGNDIARYGVDLDQSVRNLRTVAEISSSRIGHVYLITSGDFANVSILPWFVRPHYSDRSRRLRDAARVIDGSVDNLDYVDMFDVDPDRYARMEATDGFHLNDFGIRHLLDAALARRGDDYPDQSRRLVSAYATGTVNNKEASGT